MNSKLLSLNSTLQSLEEILMYSHQRLLEMNQERNIDKEILHSAKIFADDIENKFEFEIPLSKQEVERSLTLTKNALVDAAYHCSAVEYIRRRLLFDEIIDFEIASSVSKVLIQKVKCILKFIKTSRKNLGEDLPSSYSDLMKFFMNVQLMDVYIYNYRPILQDIIKESLKQSRSEDASSNKYAVESCKALQKEWDSLDSTYEIKINEIKKAICLWETYLHCTNDVKIWNRKAERNQKLYPKILKSSEIKNEISILEKFINNQEMFPCMMEKAKEIAEELGSTVNPVIRNNLLDEILSLQETSQHQTDLLKNILKELKEALTCSEKLESDLFKIKESVASICPFVDKCILSGPEMLNDKLQDIQVKLGELKEITLMLNELECQAEELKKKTLCDNYYSQICTQKEILRILSALLEQCVVKLSTAPNERNKFEDMQKMLLKWNEITENEINRHYHEPPENVLNKIETCIKSEVSENLNLLQQITKKGEWILENEKETDLISNVISSCATTTSKVSSLVESRNKELQQILSQKERATLLREKVEVFLNSSEQYLLTAVQFNEVSLRNVNDLIQATQNLQNDIQFQDETIETLRNDTEELMEKQDAFACASEKNLFKHSTQEILNKWILVKALFTERYLYLTSVKTSWENILQLLNDLEDWLDSKKKITSQTDYIESDLPRSVYLDGIKTFENLKHKTHIKITELEHDNTLNQSECDSILADFEHHKITLERYISMANNLQQKSQCSTEEIKHQVEEMQKYWEEVYGCLKHYRESVLKKSELENKDLLQQTSISLQSSEPSYLSDKQSADTSEQFGNVTHQTVDEDGITSSADNFETDSVLGTSNKDTDDVASVCQQGLYRQKTVVKSSKDVEDEFIKDLLAALKEAEERIESLETVLSEPTPCGTEDGNPPNYSRLLAACRSSIDVIQHLNQLFSERSPQESFITSDEDIQSRTEGMLSRWEKIEAATLDKESRAIENANKWQQFSRELQYIEKWLLDTLDLQTSQSIVDIDIEKFIIILQKHEKLITQITEQKQTILTLNLTGQKFMSKSRAKDNFAAVEEKLKTINDHWDKLCTVALEWQYRLQTEFLQSSEFRNTISEMELWLEDSKEKIQLVDLTEECSTTILHEQHTEFFALKQQLENCSQRVKTLLDVSVHLFHDKEKLSTSSDEILDIQARLNSILDLSHSLLLECTEILASLSALLTSRMALQEKSCHLIDSNSNDEENPNRISKCCNFLLRVVRASFPIQAVLLLLLGAALLLPKDEEELSCRFSNNFASSLNPMLHYPDGPPPV
ncbi:nesprin-1 [Trichonephila inaurata madagascariensis]|uniref:Nesprin-1 n=1 Tax=Trichonephila inaurata madagascariensis TaxID=2747483 RepID=A0A8X6WS43_9ARAC|nr:nesprin-1 [Trichonephila inaurata madagascariensis]